MTKLSTDAAKSNSHMPAPKRLSYTTARGEFSVYSWDAPSANTAKRDTRPILHFAHATGFNGSTYGPLLARLTKQFRVLAWDARGHGTTPAPLDIKQHAQWDEHAQDLLALAERWGEESGQRLYLAGHSMGATISCMIAAQYPSLVSGLLLLDPVIMSSTRYKLMGALLRRHHPLVRMAAKRRAVFPDIGIMFETYHKRGAFRTWDDAFLHAYVSGGVRKHPDGVALACTPEYESALFASTNEKASLAARQLSIPFSVLMAEQDSTTRDVAAFFSSSGPNRIRVVPHSTHFLPMEQPDVVVNEMLALKKRANLFGSDGQIGETKLLELRTRFGVDG